MVYYGCMNTIIFRCNTIIFRCLLWLTVVPALLAGRVTAAAPAVAGAAPVSLAAALAAMPDASVNDGSVVLTVQPYAVMPVPIPPEASDLPVDNAMPLNAVPINAVPTPETLAARYGRSLQVFSHVLALAPPTMTVLNTDPALTDLPLAELAGQHPVPFLLGTLTQAQLRQMSTSGLAFSDLSPDQQALLKASLPTPFEIVPKSAALPSYSMDDMKKTGAERAEIDARIREGERIFKMNTRTISGDTLLSSLRLYGFLAPEFTFDGGGNSIGEGYSENGFETTGADKLANGGRVDMFASGSSALQKMLRGDLPNTPKAGDLDWRQGEMDRTVSLQGIKTVDDLVARLSKATGLELYADMRYGRQACLARGDLKTPQAAGNVMQALALCVCGTWRKVWPAFVLTDDVAGLGARQEFLHEMVQAWSNRLTTAGTAVGGHLAEMDWLHALSFAPGDIGALTPAQVDSIHKEDGTNGGHLLWKDLPAPLRAGLHGQLARHFDGDNMLDFQATANSIAKSLTPDFKVGVDLNFRLGVALPDTGVMMLGDPYRVQMPQPPPPASAAVAAPPKPQINSIVLDKPLRGILCASKTPEEARAVVALLPKMGLNTLFLDVFTGGRTYFPNTALPPSTAQAGDVLQATLDAARTAHIPVYAVLDLLCWRKDGGAVHPQPWLEHFAEDLTITGEAPDRSVQRQMDAHTVRSDFDREYEMVQKGSQEWVSPLDPRVSALLPALVHDLAGTQGLAGIVFQDTAALGYLGIDYDEDEENISLGYTPENRLAYLRAQHTDPIDLRSTNENVTLFLPFEGSQSSFEASVPSFQSWDAANSGSWNTLRSGADKSLLARCYAAARNAAPTLPLLMRERRMGATFDPWTDPAKLNQIASLDTMTHPFQHISPSSILSFSYGPVEKAHPGRFVWETQGYGMVGGDGKRAGGEVFDLVTGGPPENLPDTLDKLNVFLKKP